MSQPPPSALLSAAGFTELLDCTQQLVYRFMLHLLGNDEDARDGVQEVFVDAWRAVQRVTPPFTSDGSQADMRRWLLHTAYQRSVSVLRHRQVLAWESLDADVDAEVLLPPGTAAFEDLIAQGDEWRAILGSLDPQDAACLVLKVLQGYTCVELAQIFGISPDATRKRLSRATQRLRLAYVAHQGRQGASSPAAGKERRDV
jgi:RNA polymerase sigma-70 factor (ECF subfamily)